MPAVIGATSKVTSLQSGLDIHHYEAGAGDPLVLLHGGGPGASGLSNYRQNYGFFVQRGYRVLMPDMIGWGQSSRPTGVPYDYELMGGSIRDWLHSLGIHRCAIAANAMGGAIALHLALETPGLFEKLVLMAPSAVAPRETYLPMPGMQVLISMLSSPGMITVDAMRALFEMMYFDPADVDERMVIERTAAANLQARDMFANVHLPSLEDRLSGLAVPTLVFWGAADRFCPMETSRTLLEKCRGSRLVAIAGCGHWVQVEKEALFNRLTFDYLQND
jgi:4,5:9,10-diseco-3-hydroxy-5,9,17-trioxoandrosta-1(10),2-diene-4-oate hydrolase